jgi:hypothetical protein
MRPKFAVGIVIGLLLILMGVFGASLFGLSWVTGQFFTEDFNTMSNWPVAQPSGGITCSAGIATFTSASIAYRSNNPGGTQAPITGNVGFEAKIMLPTGVSSPNGFIVGVITDGYISDMIVCSNGVNVFGDAGGSIAGEITLTPPVGSPIGTGWHVFDCQTDESTHTYTVSMDGTQLSGKGTMVYVGSMGYDMILRNFASASVQIDYFYVGTGVNISPPSNNGPVVNVYVYQSDGSTPAIGRTVTVYQGTTTSGTLVTSGQTGNSGNVTFSLTADTIYLFYVDSQTSTTGSWGVNSHPTVTLTLEAGQQQQQPQGSIIDQIFNNPIVKQVFLYAGILTLVASVIGLIVPKRKLAGVPVLR